jgi:hypothetical protein
MRKYTENILPDFLSLVLHILQSFFNSSIWKLEHDAAARAALSQEILSAATGQWEIGVVVWLVDRIALNCFLAYFANENNGSSYEVGCPRKWLFEIPWNTEFYAEVTSIPQNSAEVQSAEFCGIPRNSLLFCIRNSVYIFCL